MVSESGGVSIEFECRFGVKIKECSLRSIIPARRLAGGSAFLRFLPACAKCSAAGRPDLLTDFMMKILLGYAEYVMNLKERPFCCEKCGNTRAAGRPGIEK